YPLLFKFIILFRLTWLAMLILVIWMGRGYFLSGYPLYPLTNGEFSVDWAVPRYNVKAEGEAIVRLAKGGERPSGTVADSETERGWEGWELRRQHSSNGIAGILYPAFLALLLFAAAGGLGWAVRSGRIRQKQVEADNAAQNDNAPNNSELPYLLLTLPILA